MNNKEKNFQNYRPHGGADNYWLQMSESVGRLDGKLDQILATQLVQKEQAADHENRLRALEKGMWKRVGGFTVFGTLIGAVATFITKTGAPH